MTKTLADKVGQMLMAGFDGLSAPAYFLDWLREGRLGGVILFARNVQDPPQLATLIEQLQNAAKYPLLIAIDQEGGTVARLREGFTESPGALALASIPLDSEIKTEEISAILGAEMRALGINWTYAPVVDLTYNKENPTVGTRSFGADPEQIAVLASAAVRGFQAAGVAACAKHFPGLGNTAIDTHLALPRLDTPLSQLRAIDLLPYRVTIDSGLTTIMTTHTIFTALDEDYPATLSDVIVQRLIREELGFEGVITTDCMEMKAIDDNYPIADSTVRAALAGIDIILFSHTAERQAAAYEALLSAAEDGRVPASIIDAANARIEALKARFPSQKPDISSINNPEHQAAVFAAAQAAITTLRAQNGLLPLKADDARKIVLVEFSPQVDSLIQESVSPTYFSYYLKQQLPSIKSFLLPARPSAEHVAAVQAQPADLLILAGRNAHIIPEQAAAIQSLAEHSANVILLALRNPYDANLISKGAALGSGGDSRPSLEALSLALVGAFEPHGQLKL